MEPKIIFNIDEILYEMSDEEIQSGDLVIDTRNYTYGYSDGTFAGRIAVRFGWVVEGVEIKYCKKLVPYEELININ